MKYILLALQGMAVGAANIIPGISGATVAVIFRVYDRLLAAVNQLFSSKWKGSLKVLAPFAVGALVGIVALGSAIDFFIRHVPLQTTAFIAGLMAGTVPFLYKLAAKNGTSGTCYIAAGVAAVAVILMGVFTPAQSAYADAAYAPMTFYFVSGALAAAIMIVPGVSGSMVLIMLGLFPAVIHTINLAREFVMSPAAALLPPILRVALPMVGGVLLGMVLMSKLITELLKRYFSMMYFIILGLVVGTVVILFIGQETGSITPLTVITAILAFAAGAFAALLLGKQSKAPDTAPADAAHPAQ